MKLRLQHCLVAASLIFANFAAQAAPQKLDEVVAVVDRNILFQSELNERIEQVARHAQANNLALPDLKTLEQQVLDHLISEKLQLQMARRVGLQVTDAQVNQTIEQIRQSNQLTPAQFEAQLQRDGMDMNTLRDKLRKDITLQQIQQGIVQQRIHISPLEIDNFLKSADAKFWISPEYHLGHILISVPQSASSAEVEEAKAKAESLVQRIESGTPFAQVAIAESKGPTALNGGDLGWRKTSDLPSLFAEVAPTLKAGQVSAPVRSPAGFHILKLYEQRGGEQQTESQAKVRHILLKPSAILSDEEAEAKLERIRQQILNGADFAKLAKEHSEDIGSMLSGGDLGWSRPGLFVPAFEQTIEATDVGEISRPFRSRFGWHILQVQERRQEDVTDELLRQKAARVLTNRRFEDELSVWLRELRDDAYVDIKI